MQRIQCRGVKDSGFSELFEDSTSVRVRVVHKGVKAWNNRSCAPRSDKKVVNMQADCGQGVSPFAFRWAIQRLEYSVPQMAQVCSMNEPTAREGKIATVCERVLVSWDRHIHNGLSHADDDLH